MSKPDVLKTLTAYITDNGYPPSVRQLATLTGRATSTVHEHLKRMERDGRIDRTVDPGGTRKIIINE